MRAVDNILDQKASKSDLEDLEQRLMDKLQELLNNLSNMFAEKDQMRKKFLSLEKNVSRQTLRRIPYSNWNFFYFCCQIKNLYDMLLASQNK
jgi:hypothetical protein